MGVSAARKKINKKIFFAPWASSNHQWHSRNMWHTSIYNIFSKVIEFDPQNLMTLHGKDYMNQMFLSLIRKEKPDYIFLWLIWDEFKPDTLMKIKEILPDSKIFNFCGDDDIKFYNYTSAYLPFIDYTLANQENFFREYRKMGAKVFNGLGTDTKKFRFLDLEKKYDISFLGTPKADRLEYMRHLLKNRGNANLNILGAGWEKYPEFKSVSRGKITDEEFTRVMNKSSINICLSKNYFNVPHAIERFLMANACKSFVMTEYAQGYFPRFREGIDIVTFKNKKEMLKKIKFYLLHEKERKVISERAYKKTLREYSNEKLLMDAFLYAEKENPAKQEDLSKGKKIIYLDKNDISKGLKFVSGKVDEYQFIGFKDARYKNLEYREFMQINHIERSKKEVSICDCYYSSRILGDYMTIALYYSFNFDDKKYFYPNLRLPQMIVRKEFFLNNFEKFACLTDKSKLFLADKALAVFTSVPLVRTSNIPIITQNSPEHIVFPLFELKLLNLRKIGKLFTNPYLYLLLFYSFTVNPPLGRFLILNTIRRSKNKIFMAISQYAENFLSNSFLAQEAII